MKFVKSFNEFELNKNNNYGLSPEKYIDYINESFTPLEKLKYELTDEFLNFTTGEIKDNYTPLTKKEFYNIVSFLTYKQIEEILPSCKNILKELDKILQTEKNNIWVLFDNFMNFITNNIIKGDKFEVGIQTAIDDVDQFYITKINNLSYDTIIPFHEYDKELGQIFKNKNIGLLTPQELRKTIFRVNDDMFGNNKCLISYKICKNDIISILKNLIKDNTYYFTPREFALVKQALCEKYPYLETEISKLITDTQQKKENFIKTLTYISPALKYLWEEYK